MRHLEDRELVGVRDHVDLFADRTGVHQVVLIDRASRQRLRANGIDHQRVHVKAPCQDSLARHVPVHAYGTPCTPLAVDHVGPRERMQALEGEGHQFPGRHGAHVAARPQGSDKRAASRSA